MLALPLHNYDPATVTARRLPGRLRKWCVMVGRTATPAITEVASEHKTEAEAREEVWWVQACIREAIEDAQAKGQL